MDLPTHCLWCGVVLMGGATKHKPHCTVLRMIEDVQDSIARGECLCRTEGCGHKASSHIGLSCFECGKENCWS